MRTLKFFDATEAELAAAGLGNGKNLKMVQNGLDFAVSIMNFGENDNSLPYTEKLKAVFGNRFYSACGKTLPEAVFEKLKGTGVRLATAESLTGGMVAAEMVSVPGVSEFFFEGVVAYDNLAKEQRLFVKRDTLEKFGAVSRETAEEMALGLIKSGDTLAVSTTGIAGPSGGSKEKPVGTVWFGLADDKGVLHSEKRVFEGDRTKIRLAATQFALHILYRYLCGEFRSK